MSHATGVRVLPFPVREPVPETPGPATALVPLISWNSGFRWTRWHVAVEGGVSRCGLETPTHARVSTSAVSAEARPIDMCEACWPLPTHRVACAWCRTELSPGIEPTSHGICGACEAMFIAQADLG